MITRTIEAPGVEYQEIDLSRYGQNGPLVDTTVFSMGFADRGVDYMPIKTQSMQEFISQYGYPTNEAERYFFKTAQEVFAIGGVLYSAKVPYENQCKDKFTWVSYRISNEPETSLFEDGTLSSLTEIDDSITSYFTIQEDETVVKRKKTGDNESSEEAESETVDDLLMSMEEYDDYLVGNLSVDKNTIIIVNKTRNKYAEDEELRHYDIDDKTEVPEFKTKCFLGIVPVIVSPVEAMMFQKLIDKNIAMIGSIDTFSVPSVDKNYFNNPALSAIDEHFAIDLSYEDIYTDTLEKRATDLFPQIKFRDSHRLDTNYLKKIGIVVFKMVLDPSNQNKIDYIPVESFIGSLEKDAKDPITKESMFLDKIINDRSSYISFFSNYDNEKTKKASTIVVQNQKVRSLGFYELYSKKYIEVEEMMRSVDKILDHVEDPNQHPFDVVVDAGMSNIAQFVYSTNEILSSFANAKDSNYMPQDYTDGLFNLQIVNNQNNDSTKQWKRVLRRLDNFCRYTRKDCIYIADGIRSLCLHGDEKIVRNTNPKNTVKNSILPKMKELLCLNSSYSAGYCDWYSCPDYVSGSRFWCPPSIKAMYAYLFTDRYYDRWDAPAGEKRGVVQNIYDVAFSPTEKEAETIYLNNWNYAVSYPLAGILIEGQKTFQAEKTALDRVNVRRLCLTIKREVTKMALQFKYEGITPELLDSFRDKLDAYLNTVKNRNGISDYYIVLDERNNTPETIERNELHATFAIRPVKTAEFIIIRSVVVNQTANLEEVVNSVLY